MSSVRQHLRHFPRSGGRKPVKIVTTPATVNAATTAATTTALATESGGVTLTSIARVIVVAVAIAGRYLFVKRRSTYIFSGKARPDQILIRPFSFPFQSQNSLIVVIKIASEGAKNNN